MPTQLQEKSRLDFIQEALLKELQKAGFDIDEKCCFVLDGSSHSIITPKGLHLHYTYDAELGTGTYNSVREFSMVAFRTKISTTYLGNGRWLGDY